MDVARDAIEAIRRQQINKNPLQLLIEAACDPQRPEPDLSLNLDIVDMIKDEKKLSAPREAATEIVHYATSREVHQSMLALSLLDLCAKNCGYPFHLQIATKDFLNELVKRFPMKPPIVYPVNISKILELVHHWNDSLWNSSKHQHDLVHINDMMRLLSYKGYRFPSVRQDLGLIIVDKLLNSKGYVDSGTSFKTKDEMEQEDRIVQNAKLQELLRRGTPADLDEANKLMKIMAGFDLERKPDYEKKQQEELVKIEERCVLVMEIMNQVDASETISDSGAIQELISAIKSAQLKLTKWISEDVECDESATLLTLNDLINECLKRYDQLKKSPAFSSGKQPTAAGSGAQSSSAYYRISLPSVDVSHVSVNRDDTIASKPLSRDTGSLIDLGVPVESYAVKSTSIAPPTHKQPAAAVDLLGDLDGLTFSSNSFAANVPNMNATNPASFFSAPPLAFANTFNSSLSIPAPTNPPFSSMNGAVMSPASNLPTSMRNSQPPPSNQLFSQNPPATPPSSMSLSGVQSGGKMLTGGGGGGGGSANASTAFDDLTGTQFTKLPSTTSKPPSLVQMYDKNGLLMQIQCGEETRGANALSCTVIVTNTTAVLFTRFSLQLALPKLMTLQMSTPSSTTIQAAASIQQRFSLTNPTRSPVRMRFIVSYAINGVTITDQGEFDGLA